MRSSSALGVAIPRRDFFLEGVEDIDDVSDLDCVNKSIRTARIAFADFEDVAHWTV